MVTRPAREGEPVPWDAPVVAAPSRPGRGLVVLRLALAGVTLLVLLTSFAAVRATPTDAARLVAAVQQGRVVKAATDGKGHVRWFDGKVRVAAADDVRFAVQRVRPELSSDGDTWKEALRRVAPAELDLRTEAEWDDRLPSTLRWAFGISGLLAFLLLVAGPDPWLGNRWAWFWLGFGWQGPPVGLLVFLLLSGPLPGVKRPLRDERLTGWQGFVAYLVLSVLTAVGAGLLEALGRWSV